ncbi:WD repeat-containing protein [Reticulomyxa filosa]|uniref:WD repeat-containing protein n=1 Tax=Reticulomyxa filosa TaxID=46433 RepID=X6MSR8_RETFI|nr:WD repeat-containing protein [Reticulomyxa filosa]|eukprot:ETO16160.1 WD repeat-containing protein [Reticulomyxa filosa]
MKLKELLPSCLIYLIYYSKHLHNVCAHIIQHGIEFSLFNGGRYLCSGSFDNTICLCDVETSKLLHVFNGHERGVLCVDISPLQINNNNDNNKMNNISVIGGNGYTICSGSYDNTIRICFSNSFVFKKCILLLFYRRKILCFQRVKHLSFAKQHYFKKSLQKKKSVQRKFNETKKSQIVVIKKIFTSTQILRVKRIVFKD